RRRVFCPSEAMPGYTITMPCSVSQAFSLFILPAYARLDPHAYQRREGAPLFHPEPGPPEPGRKAEGPVPPLPYVLNGGFVWSIHQGSLSSAQMLAPTTDELKA